MSLIRVRGAVIVMLILPFLFIGAMAARAASQEAAALPEHEHVAPHGGALVVLGEEFAHLELVLDPQMGQLTAYALDGEAENPIRLSQETLALQIRATDGGSGVPPSATLMLHAVSNVLTGETVGDTSEFTGQADLLKGTTRFEASLADIDIKGQRFRNMPFRFPEGNEEKN